MNEKIVKTLYKEVEILSKIKEIASELEKEMIETKKNYVFICILNGGSYFFTHLTQGINLNFQVDFLTTSKYKGSMHSKDKLEISNFRFDESIDFKNSTIILVDELLDTGETLYEVRKELFDKYHCEEIKIATLMNKKDLEKSHNIKPDYCCFDVDNAFLVGWGLDYKAKYRNLKDIAILELEDN